MKATPINMQDVCRRLARRESIASCARWLGIGSAALKSQMNRAGIRAFSLRLNHLRATLAAMGIESVDRDSLADFWARIEWPAAARINQIRHLKSLGLWRSAGRGRALSAAQAARRERIAVQALNAGATLDQAAARCGIRAARPGAILGNWLRLHGISAPRRFQIRQAREQRLIRAELARVGIEEQVPARRTAFLQSRFPWLPRNKGSAVRRLKQLGLFLRRESPPPCPRTGRRQCHAKRGCQCDLCSARRAQAREYLQSWRGRSRRAEYGKAPAAKSPARRKTRAPAAPASLARRVAAWGAEADRICS